MHIYYFVHNKKTPRKYGPDQQWYPETEKKFKTNIFQSCQKSIYIYPILLMISIIDF